jgi:PDZ domain
VSESEFPDPEDTPTEATPAEATPAEPPTEAAATPEGVEPTAAMPVATAAADPPATAGAGRSGWDTGRVLAVSILVLVLGGGAGFLIGRTTADSGPTSLAAAVDETAKGDLPAGDFSLDQLLGSARDRLGADGGGLLGGLLGGSGKGGDASGVLGRILDQLGNRLGGSSTPSAPDTAPFLGVALEGAPSGASGATIAQVTTGSPAADAGVRVGDVVTAVDGTAVADPAAVATAVRAHQPGDQITLAVTRDSASVEVKVRLGNADSSSTPSTPPTTRTT